MTKPSTIIVRVAASLLPARSRDRYREQWLGELRDAPELGIRTSEIAVGSIAFAVTRVRALPGLGPVAGESVMGRSRLAVGLSLSAAVLAISQFATVAAGGLTGSAQYDFTIFTASMLLAAFAILAPIVALVLVLAIRGVTSRVRIAVVLLVLASAVTALRGMIDLQSASRFLPWPFTPGAVVYPVAIVLVAFAGVLVWREFQPLEASLPPQRRSRPLLISGAGGILIATAVAVGFAHAVALWAARPPLFFGLAFTESNRVAFENWLTLKVEFEGLMSTVLSVWLAIGIIGALIVALSGFSRRATTRRLIAVSLGVFCLFLLFYGSVLGFLNMGSSHIATTEPVELLQLIGRWGLVAVVLVMVGGVRGRSTSLVTARV